MGEKGNYIEFLALSSLSVCPLQTPTSRSRIPTMLKKRLSCKESYCATHQSIYLLESKTFPLVQWRSYGPLAVVTTQNKQHEETIN